jgi:hypothetical protein
MNERNFENFKKKVNENKLDTNFKKKEKEV